MVSCSIMEYSGRNRAMLMLELLENILPQFEAKFRVIGRTMEERSPCKSPAA